MKLRLNEGFQRGNKGMKTTLLIMAAGIGIRFGDGIKQLELVDSNNHIITNRSFIDDLLPWSPKLPEICRVK